MGAPISSTPVRVAIESQRWERVLTWLVGLSQIVLVFLGYVTFEYTLVPLYKQAALENESARLTIEMDKLQVEKDTLARDMETATADLTNTQQAKLLADKSLVAAQQQAAAARKEAMEAVSLASAAKMETAAARAQTITAKAEATDAKTQATASLTRAAELKVEAEHVYLKLRREVLYVASQRIVSCIENNDSSIETVEACIDGHFDEQSPVRASLRPDDATALGAALQTATHDWAPRFVATVNARNQARKQARDALAQLRKTEPMESVNIRDAENRLRTLENEGRRERTALFSELFGRVRNFPTRLSAPQ